MSNVKELLDKKIDLREFLAGPFMAIYDTINNLLNRKKKPENNYSTQPFIYDVRQGHPISVKAEMTLTQYEKMYGKIESEFAMNTIKMGLKREICEQIMQSDLFEWQIEETAMGTKVAARIIVNKFDK